MKRKSLFMFLGFILLTAVACNNSEQDLAKESETSSQQIISMQQTQADESTKLPKPVDSTIDEENLQEQAVISSSNDEEEKSLVQGIYIENQGKNVNMIWLDDTFFSNPPVLSEQVQDSLQNMPMNQLVEVEIDKHQESAQIEGIEPITSWSGEMQYIGFSDNNFAELQKGKFIFVVQVKNDLVPLLKEIENETTIHVRLANNSIANANPVLEDFKKNP